MKWTVGLPFLKTEEEIDAWLSEHPRVAILEPKCIYEYVEDEDEDEWIDTVLDLTYSLECGPYLFHSPSLRPWFINGMVSMKDRKYNQCCIWADIPPDAEYKSYKDIPIPSKEELDIDD